MPTTTAALPALDNAWAIPIFGLSAKVRAAVAPLVEDDGVWEAAEAGQATIRTGYAAADRTASAGQYAAHLLRLRAIDRVDRGRAEPWTLALATATTAINSWDWDTRMQAALDLRRTFKNVPDDEHDDAVRQTRLVSAWLTHAGNRQLIPSTAHLAGYALDHTPLTPTALAAAWYATHGPRLLLELSARGSASSEVLLRQAVRGVDAARILSRTETSDHAGVTSTLIDAWLGRGTPDAGAV
ncbi:hypothetical protein [Cellulomonas cellasea]|uniref:Uncharacterized protein n=1 Tax=Cellulomonas cellasea TaxID=43670 RepID=A0A7W4UK12_9CELL|nr:hypothetical protein [Cellulomonas cellasea]MBB2925562.1 hypothetical protein [Cellulomonas cellasea]